MFLTYICIHTVSIFRTTLWYKGFLRISSRPRYFHAILLSTVLNKYISPSHIHRRKGFYSYVAAPCVTDGCLWTPRPRPPVDQERLRFWISLGQGCIEVYRSPLFWWIDIIRYSNVYSHLALPSREKKANPKVPIHRSFVLKVPDGTVTSYVYYYHYFFLYIFNTVVSRTA